MSLYASSTFDKGRLGSSYKSTSTSRTSYSHLSSAGNVGGSSYTKSSYTPTSSYSAMKNSTIYTSKRYNNSTADSYRSTKILDKKGISSSEVAEPLKGPNPREQEDLVTLTKTRVDLRHNVRGFQAMCVILQHYCDHVLPRLNADISNVKSQLHVARTNLDVQSKQRRTLEVEREREKEEMRNAHENAINNLETSLRLEMNTEKELHHIQCSSIRSEFQEKEKRWMELTEKNMREISEQIELERKELTSKYESTIRNMKIVNQKEVDELKSALLIATVEPSEQSVLYEKEIDSLRSVLEMKTEEIHQLRAQNNSLAKELELLPSMIAKMAVSEQKNAEIKEALQLKRNAEKKFAKQNAELMQMLEKERAKIKRLVMDNEQLQYKLQEKNNCTHDEGLLLKRQLPDDFVVDLKSPKSPSLVRMYAENGNHICDDMSVTVYSNNGIQQVFTFNRSDEDDKDEEDQLDDAEFFCRLQST